MKSICLCLLVCLWIAGYAAPTSAIECTFTNPLLPAESADPSLVYHDGAYYLIQSSGGMQITRSETLTGLAQAQPALVWTPPPGEDYSFDLWAPELQYIEERWYIYVAATNSAGNNPSHRMYVLRADTDDPLGPWTMMGKVYDPESDKWAIDGVVFEWADQLYMIWSGWPGDVGDFPQNLYIAEMSDPMTISGPRHLISEPQELWERTHAAINEAPQVFINSGTLSIVYSADASWLAGGYSLGMLTLIGDNPLDRDSWTKTGPVMDEVIEGPNPVYAPGHTSNPVPSPDGSETWFLYHAKTSASGGWSDRNIRLQPLTWAEDGTPIFPTPARVGEAVPYPSGEACGVIAEFETIELPDTTSDVEPGATPAAGGFLDVGESLVNTSGSFTVAADVQLSDTDTPSAFVSQDGGIVSNFVLGYNEGRFTFTMNDGFGRQPVSAVSDTIEVEDGEWYTLAGVFDAAAGELILYVNGAAAGTAAFNAPWVSRGNTIIGAARRQTERVDLINGAIRSVRLYGGALSADEVAALEAE